MGLRDAVAFEQGADEGLLAAAAASSEHRATLDHRHEAALEVADAYLGVPADMDADGWARLTATLSPTEIAQLAMQLTKFSRNKVRVSLGFDLAEVTRRLYRPVDLTADP